MRLTLDVTVHAELPVTTDEVAHLEALVMASKANAIREALDRFEERGYTFTANRIVTTLFYDKAAEMAGVRP